MRRRRRLPRILLNAATAGSVTIFVFVMGWWHWGPPPAWRESIGYYNSKWLAFFDKYPSERPVEGYYALPLPDGNEVEFGSIVFWSALLPASRCGAWTREYGRTIRDRRRVERRGRCTSCGYDLRATPDRCPECGAVPPPSA